MISFRFLDAADYNVRAFVVVGGMKSLLDNGFNQVMPEAAPMPAAEPVPMEEPAPIVEPMPTPY
jgi:hypothetical protein